MKSSGKPGIPLLIDTDPGIDDALAIALACRSPEFDVVALTAAAGNKPIDITWPNAHRVLAILGRDDIPVGRGPAAPSTRPLPPDPFSHGADGLAGFTEQHPIDVTLPDQPPDAAELICEMAHRYPGELRIAALAPFTNLARAIDLEPDLAQLVHSVTAIGGIFGLTPGAYRRATGGNPMSEWNVFVDPEAADAVFRAGFDLTAVGLDVATDPRNDLSDEHRAGFAAHDNPIAKFTNAILAFLDGRAHASYCALIDMLAIAHLITPEHFATVPVHAAVEIDGTLTRGVVVVDHRENFAWTDLPVVNAVANLDFNKILTLFTTRLTT